MPVDSTAAHALPDPEHRPEPGRAASLRGLCGGAVLLPEDETYDVARAAWNLAVDQQPAAIAYPGNPAEVTEVLRAAAGAGLRVAPQGTGHNAGPLAALHDVVLLRTSGMIGVRVDPDAQRMWVQAGARWADAVAAGAPYSLAALHGAAHSVGVVGYSLGGGIGWYSRAHGQQCNSVTAVDLVTADGAALRVDAGHDPDLFWALRGGGGSFGVVTRLEFALYPVRSVYAGLLAWDWADTGRVLRRWAEWSREAPDSASTIFRVQELDGRRVAVIEGALLGADHAAQRLLRAVRELKPEIDTFAATAPGALHLLPADPRGPAPVVASSALLTGLPDAAVDAFVEHAGPHSGSSLRVAELRHLGGALGRRDPEGGALGAVDGEYLFFAAGLAHTETARARGAADAARLVTALRAHTNGVRYLNFTTGPADVSAGYAPADWQRLRRIRTAVDPGELILANHAVPAIPWPASAL